MKSLEMAKRQSKTVKELPDDVAGCQGTVRILLSVVEHDRRYIVLE